MSEVIKAIADMQHILLLVGLFLAYRWFQAFQRERQEEFQREVREVMDTKLKNGLRDTIREEVRAAILEMKESIRSESRKECDHIDQKFEQHDQRLREVEDLVRSLKRR